MSFNKEYLITKRNSSAEKEGVNVYSYKACRIMESYDMIEGRLTHTVAFRKEECGRYLTPEEILGILDTLGMRHDGTMVMEKTLAKRVIYFMQSVDAEAA